MVIVPPVGSLWRDIFSACGAHVKIEGSPQVLPEAKKCAPAAKKWGSLRSLLTSTNTILASINQMSGGGVPRGTPPPGGGGMSGVVGPPRAG